jgi:WD40 repeat protein/DNA-binding winged helix-turn-helix (wHTH) protein/energy-coupling factor transporter ATP-binding protein EcfA2
MSHRGNHLRSFDRYSLDTRNRVFLKDGEPVPLEPKEFDLLAYMVANANRLLSKRELMDNVWGDASVEEQRLSGVVHSLRRKAFGDADREYIVTAYGRGYRFDAEIDEPHVPDSACPWVGLRAFDEAHARYFYGRDDEVSTLVERLKKEKLVAIIGSSGCGKSSLARAGIVPALRKDDSGGAAWKIAFLRPAHTPLMQLAAAILELSRRRQNKQETDALAGHLQAGAETLAGRLTATGDTRPSPVLLVIDQFEEVFSSRVKITDRDAFIENIVAAVEAPAADIHVVLTVRTDFLQRMEDYPALWSMVSDRQHGVRRFSREDLRLAIEKPAEAVRLKLEDDLVDEILEDLGEAPGALPLLSHTMAELFKEREGVWITFRAYRAMGKVRGAIEHHADLVFASLTSVEQEIARQVLIRLTDVGLRSGSDAGLRLTLEELVTDPERAREVRQVVKRLSDERLLTTGSEDETLGADDQEQHIWVEVSHVALIQHWPLLAGWINEKRDALRVFHSLDAVAKRWDKKGRTSDFLYHDYRLTQALKELPDYVEFTDDIHRDFLQASEELAEQKRREEKRRLRKKRQVRWLSAGLASILVITIIIYFNLQRAKKQRDLADSLRRVADATSQLSFDPELSMLLAIESGRRSLTSQTESILRQSLAASRLRARYVGHQGQVISVDQSPDGKFLLTCSLDKGAWIWDVNTRQPVRKLGPHPEGLNWAAYSPDGGKVVTASRDGVTRVWDANTGALLKELRVQPTPEQKSINHAIFSPDGTHVLTAGGDGISRIWDYQSGEVIRQLKGHGGHVNTVAYSPDGKLIGSASYDRTAIVWDAQTGKQVKTLSGHQDSVLYISFSPDGGRILTASKDGTARVWEVGSWKESLIISRHLMQVNCAEFSPDGRLILTASHDGTARVWDAGSGVEVLDLLGHESAVNTAIFSVDGRQVFTASGDFTARVWDLETAQTATTLRGHEGAVYSCAFSPDGQRILTAGEDRTARIWDARTGQQLNEIQHPTPVRRAVFNSDGTSVATAGADGVGRIWDAASGGLKITLPGSDTALNSISISPDSVTAVTAAADGSARVWDLRTQSIARKIDVSKGEVTDATFSPDGSSIATADKDNRVHVWNIKTGESEFRWNVQTREVNSVTFSPDGRFLLAACADGTARVWDFRDNKAVAVLRGHGQQVNSAAFSPDGNLILTASEDQSVRLWEFGVRQVLFQLRDRGVPIRQATFSPNGRLIASADDRGNVNVYACEICGTTGEELLDLAEKHKTRELTAGERVRFLSLAQ